MIELKITKTDKNGASEFSAEPRELFLGGQGAGMVDQMHVEMPEEWKGMTVRVTFVPQTGAPAVDIVPDDGVIDITAAMTAGCKGRLVVDAVSGEGYVAYSTGANYTTYHHPLAGSNTPTQPPSEWERLVRAVDKRVEAALKDAKENGQFDGKDGADGVSVQYVNIDPGTQHLIITLSNGKVIDAGELPKGEQGVSVAGVAINENSHLIVTLSDGEKLDAGEIPSGGGGSYTLPVATPDALGGVKPVAKTDEMTQEIGVDADGRLWTAPTSGTSGGETEGGGESSEPTVLTETLTTWRGKQSGSPTLTAIDGSDDSTISGSVSYTEDYYGYFAIAFPGEISGGHVTVEWDASVLSHTIIYIFFTTSPALPTDTELNYVGRSPRGNLAGNSAGNHSSAISGEISLTVPSKTTAHSTYINGPVEFDVPEGYYPWLWFRRDNDAEVTPATSNADVLAWFVENVTITVSKTVQAEATSELSVDDDYAQNYGISTLSLVTEDASNIATDTGLDAEYAAVVEQAKNAWMVEANGNINKIPLIIHTDQHGNFSKPLWDSINGMVDWHNISKVLNLGDTVSSWSDTDTEHPLTKDQGLEDYLSAMKSIPYSKRIEVFGNHDTWQIVDGETVGLAPQNYLRKYFKNIYARGKDNYGNMVVYDDNYNVKYLVISGMAYDSDIGGYSHYVIPSASWEWIITQLSEADGYDVIILSHVPLGNSGESVTDPTGETTDSTVGTVDWVARTDLWTARKNKTSGSFTDQYGVTHTYDFSGCDGEILCGLHGHQHYDGYYYVGDTLLDAFFDAYYINPRAIHFVLVDRENRQLNVWKVDNTPQFQNYQIPLDKPIL